MCHICKENCVNLTRADQNTGCIVFDLKKLNEVIPHCTRSVNCRLGLQHFNEYNAYYYSLTNKSINKVLANL